MRQIGNERKGEEEKKTTKMKDLNTLEEIL